MIRSRLLALAAGTLFLAACGTRFTGCASRLPPDVAAKGIPCDTAVAGSATPERLLPVAVSIDERIYGRGTALDTNLNMAVTNDSTVNCLFGGHCPPRLPVIQDVYRRSVRPPTDSLPDCTAASVSLAPGQTKSYSFRVSGLYLAAGVYSVTGFQSEESYGRYYFAVC